MHARAVDQQPDGRLAQPAGMQRAQERVLDPDQRGAGAPRDGRAAMRRGRGAPDAHEPVRPGPAQRHLPAGIAQHPAHPGVQRSAVVDMKAPGDLSPGAAVSLVVVMAQGPQPPAPSAAVASAIAAADPSEPVSAAIVRSHCVNGASVTYSVSWSRTAKSRAMNMPLGRVRSST